MEWTYKRGRWIPHMDYPRTLREHEAADRVEAWSRQRRWLRFPQLGPVPEKWMRFGPHPGPAGFMGEVLKSIYLPPIRHYLNQESPLLRFINKKAA